MHALVAIAALIYNREFIILKIYCYKIIIVKSNIYFPLQDYSAFESNLDSGKFVAKNSVI